MYTLYLLGNGGGWIKYESHDSVNTLKLWADMYFASVRTEVRDGDGLIVTNRTSTGSWQA